MAEGPAGTDKWTPAAKAGLVVILLVVFGIYKWCGADAPPPNNVAVPPSAAPHKPPPDAPLGTAIALPSLAPKLGDILGATPAQVRKVLGPALPAKSIGTAAKPEVDGFVRGPVGFFVNYSAAGRAVLMEVSTDGHQVDEPAVRTWLGVAATGVVAVAGREVHVRVVTPDAIDFEDAQWEADIAKRTDAARAKADDAAQRTARTQAASLLEKLMLEDGRDATVRVDGTALRIHWVLCSRPAVYNLTQRFGDDFRSQGFTKITCDTGYETVVQDL